MTLKELKVFNSFPDNVGLRRFYESLDAVTEIFPTIKQLGDVFKEHRMTGDIVFYKLVLAPHGLDGMHCQKYSYTFSPFLVDLDSDGSRQRAIQEEAAIAFLQWYKSNN